MVRACNKTLDRNIVTDQLLNNVYVNRNSLDTQIETILNGFKVENENITPWLLRVISVIDLTTLSGDDTRCNVIRLCQKAANPLKSNVINKLGINDKIMTAAVCVYPTRIADAYDIIKQMELTSTIQIASVATGFPSGLFPLHSRLQEISYAIDNGATEIDVVLDRSLVLTGKWQAVYNEVVEMRKACGDAHLKVILGVGELGSYENVYKASMVSMVAGADFIKTSTGKEAMNATLPVGLVMCRAIRKFYQLTGIKVGLKPAGGIKTGRDAVNWLLMVYAELGSEWIHPNLFRIGASSLLDDVVKCLENSVQTAQ